MQTLTITCTFIPQLPFRLRAPSQRKESSALARRAQACGPQTGEIGGPHEGPLLRRLFVQSYRAALQLCAFRNLDMPASRISFLSRDRHNLASLGERWKKAIASLPAGTFELACHPGLFERGFSETDPIRIQRELELEWLTGREWIDAVRESGVRLITYRDLCERPTANHARSEAPVLQ